jgi:hypothetical protein
MSITTDEEVRINHRMRQFNPKNEPIVVCQIIEKKETTQVQPQFNRTVRDDEMSLATGTECRKKAPPFIKKIRRGEKEQEITGPLAGFIAQDADNIDPMNDVPVKRFFGLNQIIKMTLKRAIWAIQEGYVRKMPYWKDEDGNVATDADGIMLPEYAKAYMLPDIPVYSMLDRIIELEKMVVELRADKKGR